MLHSYVRVRKHPEKLNMSPSILVLWRRGDQEVLLQLMGPRQGVLAAEGLNPKAARKLARALLRAANEAEGRPVPRLADASETPGTLINLRS